MSRILLGGASVSSRNDLFNHVTDWEERVTNDKELPGGTNVAFWGDSQNRWNGYSGDFKLIACVAIICFIVGLKRKTVPSKRRLAAILAVVSIGYAFCLAEWIYATKQFGYAVCSSFERHLDDQETDRLKLILARGEQNLTENKEWLIDEKPTKPVWWELEWINTQFLDLVREQVLGTPVHEYRRPLLYESEIEKLNRHYKSLKDWSSSKEETKKVEETKKASALHPGKDEQHKAPSGNH